MAWLRKIHAWIGLGLCLLLALMALTGASMVFEPYLRGAGPPGPSPATTGDLSAVMATATKAFGAGSIRSVVFASSDAARHEVRLKGEKGVWIDPANGQVAPFGTVDHAFEWIFDLHHHLLSGDTGTVIVGWIGLTALIMTLSGLVIWWPARRSFKAAVVPKRKSRAGWLAAHRDLAVMVAPLVIMSTLTGASMALPDLSRAIFHAPAAKAPKDVKVAGGPTDWDAALAAAHARFPAGVIRMAVAPGKTGQPASVRVRQPGEWHANGRTIIYLDPPTGRIVGVYGAMIQPTSARAYNAFWPVHAARVGGIAWKIIVFLGGISLAALSLYGGEAYRRRLFKIR